MEQHACIPSAPASGSGRHCATYGNWKFQPFAPHAVRLGGEIRHRMGLTGEKILHHLDVEELFVRHFRHRSMKPEVPGGFAGYGMFLDAVVKAAIHGIGGDEMLRFKTERLAELIDTQSEDGAITIFSGPPGYWDNHDQAYMIQAFVLDYRHYGNERALQAALRLGNFLIHRKTSVNLGLETAFLMLAEASGDRRFSAYCRDIFLLDQTLDVYDRMTPVNGVAHVYTWIARCLAQLQYRQLTGSDTPQLRAGTEELFRRVFSNYSSISGSCSGGFYWGELWDDTQIGLGRWGETCVSAYLLRCAAKYLEFEADPRLGDLYERILYNAFFGAQSEDGLRQRYFIPFNEPGQWYDHETYCCPNNLRRMMFELPDAVYFRTAGGIAVNLYTESTLDTPTVTLHQKTRYPESETVELTISAKKTFPLTLRIPGWCEHATVDGTPASPGWFSMTIAPGETVVRLRLPMEVRQIRGTMAQTGRIALMRGPLVYAVEMERNRLDPHAMDLLTVDNTQPFELTKDGIETTCLIPNQDHPVKKVLFTRFSSEKRTRTYFPATLAGTGENDSLFQPSLPPESGNCGK